MHNTESYVLVDSPTKSELTDFSTKRERSKQMNTIDLHKYSHIKSYMIDNGFTLYKLLNVVLIKTCRHTKGL